MKAPAVLMSTVMMFVVGYYINLSYSRACLKLPIMVSDQQCRPVFVFALSFISCDKIASILDGTRVRGLFFQKETLETTGQLEDFLLFKLVAQCCNMIFMYTLLKSFRDSSYMVSITRIQSRITGYICASYVPTFMRAPFFGLFSKMYGVKIEEATRHYSEYTTFTDFFTRTLRPGVREIHRELDKYSLCSPCDGTVLTIGKVNSADSTIDCVKGRSYRLDDFMLGVFGDNGAQDNANRCQKLSFNHSSVEGLLKDVEARGNDLHYMVIYLSPGDYHRFHSPAIHTARYRRHIVGYLSPVKPSYVRKHKDVFRQNERVNIFGDWYGDL